MKFTYGETVRTLLTAPEPARPGSLGSVCAIRVLDRAQEFSGTVEGAGSTIYLVEFGDGTAVEISERFLAPPDGPEPD